MAWRFKASKYKNAAPIVPKFENSIRDLNIGCYRSHGNFIAASAAYMAFNWDTQGSNLAVLPLDQKGRVNKASVPLIHAHSDMVTDFQFSPFDDGLLATGSQDSMVKLWRIPESGMPAGGITNPELTLPEQPRRVETVTWNPNVDSILATSSATSLTVWDVITGKEIAANHAHEDEIQSVSWQQRGELVASNAKDRQLRIFDPRANSVAAQCESHDGMKDSKVVWVGGENRLLSTGFGGDRCRELIIRDMRNLATPEKQMSLDMSSGILIPLFDPDTNMCFLCGKGDRYIQFIEITDKEPYIVEGLRYTGEQTKGATLVPKRAMDVMQGEVNRVLQLCDSSIMPITWQVPRKTYRDYHADIYPETFGLEAGMGPENWLQGQNFVTPKMNLDPKKRPKENLTVFHEKTPLSERPRMREVPKGQENGAKNGHNGSAANGSANGDHANGSNGESEFKKPAPKPRIAPRANSVTNDTNNVQPEESPRPRPRVSASNPPVGEMEGLELETNGTTNGSSTTSQPIVEDSGDEGLAMLRRQPSIKDRKKLFEQTIQKNQEKNGGGPQPGKRDSVDSTAVPAKIRERTPSDPEENKENSAKVEFRSKNIFLANDRKSPEEAKPAAAAAAKRPVSKMFGRVSKFKHLKGDVVLKGRFENIKNLSKTMPAECNFVHANADRVAVPLTGPGGKLAVFETRKPGRVPDGVQPVLINGTTVMDFAFDPFDNARIVAACDDGYVRVWQIPEGGLTHQINTPEANFPAHSDKVQIVKFHPLASDVIVTVGFDKTIKIWNLNETDEPKLELEGHGDQIYSVEWSQCGRFLATVCRDGKIRLFEPRKNPLPVLEGGEIVPKKGARVVWAMGGEYLIVTGFTRQSERSVMVYRTLDLEMLHAVTLDVSPAILVPFYDADSNTLFLAGKGESTVTTFEVSTDSPHLFPLSPYRPAGLHQGFAFIHKNVCNVRDVEFARAFRLTNTTIEPVAFSVPRVKTAFFQDDLFPPTMVTWEPTVSADEWLGGSEKPCRRISLKPEGMKELSGTTTPSSATPTSSNRASVISIKEESASNGSNSFSKEMAKQKENDIGNSVSKALGDVNEALEQDNMEGVEEKEWEEES